MTGEKKSREENITFIYNKLVNLPFENFQTYFDVCTAACNDVSTTIATVALFCAYSVYQLGKDNGNDNLALLQDMTRRACRTAELSEKLYIVFNR